MRVFVAGGAGAIGQRLVPRLVARGHHVVATTRSSGKLELLRALGAAPMVMDGLNAFEVTRIRGSSNAKAKRELGWWPRWASWREGFDHALFSRTPELEAA